jgi:hypothetical protein
MNRYDIAATITVQTASGPSVTHKRIRAVAADWTEAKREAVKALRTDGFTTGRVGFRMLQELTSN